MNIGVFGGSFDPIHYGHLLLAEQCIELAGLDRVLLIPASQSPLKNRRPVASDRHRMEMLQLAIADHPKLEWSRLEIDRGEISYTVDTLRQLKQAYPDDTLHLMMGADSLRDFDRWKEPGEILALSTLLIINRPTVEEASDSQIDWEKLSTIASDDQISQWQRSLVQTQQFDFRSTEIRQRAAEGRSLRYRTPRAVEMYIQTQNLYRA